MTTMLDAATTKILLILSDGKPHSCAQIAEALGYSVVKTRVVLADLRKREHIESTPVQYQITPAGTDRAQWKPADHNARKNERRREARKVKASAKSQEQHTQILKTVPSSVWQLGRM